MAVTSNIKAGRAFVEITADSSKFRRSLGEAQSELRSFSKSCTALGRKMVAFGGMLSLPFALAERSFAGFDDKMRLVQAVTSSTGEAFESLTKTAQRLGRETSFTAQQVADAMIALGRMGFDPREIEASISSVLNLSRATGTELAESADIAANSMRIFGLEASKMTQVSDVLTATANGSAQTLTDLFEGLKIAGPQAAAAGESLDEICAALGVMANMGVKGSLAGTALRKAYVQFSDIKVQKILREVGVEATDSSGNLRKMAEVMRDIAVATQKLPTAERLAFMKDVFDVRGMMSGMSLTKDIGELDAFLAKLKDVSGQADATAKAMDAGIGGSFRLFQSAVEGAMNATGEALNATIKPMVERITAVINSFTKWIEANKGLVASVAVTVGSIAALGAALLTIGTVSRVLSTAVGALGGVFSTFGAVQTALAAKGVVVQGAFSLMARAFADYRNAAIPAMVGTSRLLAALNLPIDSRAKQIAASLVLMSNAEAAAAAKSAIASRFAAVTAAMKSLNAATIAATISTKAHAAAQAVGTVAAKAATAAHVAFAAVGRALTLNHAKAAVTAGVAATANVALAATTKVVAAGYLAASAAATAFCAIPITWVLIGIVAALGGLCAYMASATKHTAELSDRMQTLRDKGDQLRSTDQLRMERLQQLAEKEQLSNAEMAEAEKLANTLKGRYGDLGISIDRASKSISMAADAQEKFNEAMKAQALHQIEAEISELWKNISELDAENESLTGFWINAWNTVTFRMGKAADDIEANGERISEAMKKIADARKRMDAIKGGDKDALTGGKSEHEQLEERVTQGRSEKHASSDEAEGAAKKAAEIEKRLIRETRSELENEISDIRELRDEYKALIQTMLSYEKSKKDKDLEKIADLEGRLAEADTTAERRIKTAEAKAKRKFDKEIADLQEGFDQTYPPAIGRPRNGCSSRGAEDIAQRRSEGETDRKVESALKDDAAAGMKLLTDLINQSKLAATQAKAEFQKALAEAQSDGDISDDEEKRIRKAQDAYSLAESLVDKYESKLRSAQEATAKQTSIAKPQGTFYANAAQSLRGSQMERNRPLRVVATHREATKPSASECRADAHGNAGNREAHEEDRRTPERRSRRRDYDVPVERRLLHEFLPHLFQDIAAELTGFSEESLFRCTHFSILQLCGGKFKGAEKIGGLKETVGIGMHIGDKHRLCREHGERFEKKILELALPIVVVHLERIVGVYDIGMGDKKACYVLKQFVVDGRIAIVEMLVETEALVGYVGLADKRHHPPEDGLSHFSRHIGVFGFPPDERTNVDAVLRAQTDALKVGFKCGSPRSHVARLVVEDKTDNVVAGGFLVRLKTAGLVHKHAYLFCFAFHVRFAFNTNGRDRSLP